MNRVAGARLSFGIQEDGVDEHWLILEISRGMAPVAHVLFNKFMNYNPKNPKWVNRDRFVLS